MYDWKLLGRNKDDLENEIYIYIYIYIYCESNKQTHQYKFWIRKVCKNLYLKKEVGSSGKHSKKNT